MNNLKNLTTEELRTIVEILINAPMPQQACSMSTIDFYTHYLQKEINEL